MVRCPYPTELARCVRIRELPDAIVTHVLGKLHRLLMSGGGVVAAAAGLGMCSNSPH